MNVPRTEWPAMTRGDLLAHCISYALIRASLSKEERSAVAAEKLFRQRSQVIAWLLRAFRLRPTSKGRPTVSRFRDLTEGLRCYRHPILVPHNGSPQAVPCCLIRTSKSRSPYDVLIVGPIWTFWERSSMGRCFFRHSWSATSLSVRIVVA